MIWRNRRAATRRANLLFVDDNDDLRGMVGRYLSRRGYQVSVAASACDALGALDDQAIDLIIIDVEMPGINGLELLQFIREHHPNLPSVLYAGCRLDEALLREAQESGAHGLLSKDMPLSQLLMEIHRLLDYPRDLKAISTLAFSEQELSANDPG